MSKLTVRQIGDLIQKSATDKAVYTRIWDLCYLFTQGRQHLAFDKTLQKYVKPQNRRGALTVNRLLNIYRTVSAKLLTVYPGVGVMPASPSSEDISKAVSFLTSSSSSYITGTDIIISGGWQI